MDKMYESWMSTAIMEARAAALDVPVGAALLDRSLELVSRSRNNREMSGKLIGHAEANVIFETWGKHDWGDLAGFTLVSTLEPCLACASLIRETGVSRVVFGAANPLKGAAGSVYDVLRDRRLGSPVEVISGVRARECQALLDQFFSRLRKSSV